MIKVDSIYQGTKPCNSEYGEGLVNDRSHSTVIVLWYKSRMYVHVTDSTAHIIERLCKRVNYSSIIPMAASAKELTDAFVKVSFQEDGDGDPLMGYWLDQGAHLIANEPT